jgi:opacity protein-like surface antigen
MKLLNIKISRFLLLLLPVISYNLFAQGVYTPLRVQGLDRFQSVGARSTGMGGASVAAGKDATDIFTNPAIMMNIDKISLRGGASYIINNYDQTQDWTPNKLYAELSLIFRNEDTYKTKPFDDIKPAWNKTLSKAYPSAIAAVVPFKVSGVEFAFGLGYAQYINLNHFYQNNNALDPNIGQMRPAPIPRLLPGDSLKVKWFQNYNQREGAVYGITPALNVNILSNFSAAVSVAILNGSTDDYEFRMDRGLLTLKYNNLFTLEPAAYSQVKSGTSDYKGTMINLGLLYNDEKFSVGASLKPSYSIKREWNRNVVTTQNGSAVSVSESGNDEVKYPAIYSLGFALYPTKNITIAIDYEIKKLEKAEFTNVYDTVFNNWLSGNILKIGAEYKLGKIVKIRGGYRGDTQTFAPEGTALLDEPASGSVYTLGLGLDIRGILFDLSYQYSYLRYEDTWLSNNNINKTERHTFMFEVGYYF